MESKPLKIALATTLFIASAFLAGRFFPLTATLLSLGLLSAAVAFVTMTRVRDFVNQQFPFLTNHPNFRLVSCCIAVYCGLLLYFSVPRTPSAPVPVAAAANGNEISTLLEEAEVSLAIGDLDRTADMARRLEIIGNGVRPEVLASLRARLSAAVQMKEAKQANDRVLRLTIDANQELASGRYANVEQFIREALSVPKASELGDVSKLANKLLKAKVAAAYNHLDGDNYGAAVKVLREAESLPGVTDLSPLNGGSLRLANAWVAKKVAKAKEFAEAYAWEDAERELSNALSTDNATELADARALLAVVRKERARSTAQRPGNEPIQKRGLEFVKSRMATDGNILEFYVSPEELDLESLKQICRLKRDGTKAACFYSLVVVDVEGNAKFPNSPFTERVIDDARLRNSLRAIYQYNRSTDYGELQYYEPGDSISPLKRLRI